MASKDDAPSAIGVITDEATYKVRACVLLVEVGSVYGASPLRCARLLRIRTE